MTAVTDIPFVKHRSEIVEDDDFAVKLVGVKATEIKKLPDRWVPPFFVVTTAAYRHWLASARPDGGSSFDNVLFTSALIESLAEIAGTENANLIARSSATDETLGDRGRYHSYRCSDDLESVQTAVSRVWGDFRLQASKAPSEMAVIIQRFVDPLVSGHLSNERRVSRSAGNWLCEMDDALRQRAWHIRFSTASVSRGEERLNLDMSCSNAAELEHRLKLLARFRTSKRERAHMEWLWDGARVWVVQSDREPETGGAIPGEAYRPEKPTQFCRGLRAFVEEPDAKGGWQKIQAVRVFRDCRLPTGQVFVLEDRRIQTDLAAGRVPVALRADLEELLHSPIVIRTDIEPLLPREHLLLPRTESVSQVSVAEDFLKQTARRFVDDGIPPGSFCFIAHRFIRATACAQALARPGVPRVRVDSTWGLPDGLQFYPHDSFEVGLPQGKLIRRHVRAKVEYLDVESTGDWVEKRTRCPWDWKLSLSPKQLSEIAQATSAVALRIGKAVDVMFFVGVDPATGHPPCLPWFFSTNEVQPSAQLVEHTRFVGQRVVISSGQDVESLRERLRSQIVTIPISIRLKPTPSFLRSEVFLKMVADLSNEYRIAIELEGSILSYAYYVLSRSGARIRCIDPFISRSRRKKFGKLVRNLIPLRIESRGETARVRRVSPTQLLRLLKAKAVEEALELCSEKDPDRTIEEIADLVEVIRTVCDLYDRSFDDVIAAAERKRSERGGFEKGIVLVETRDVPLIGATSEHLFSSTPEAAQTNAGVDSITSSEVLDAVRRVRSTGRGLVISLVPPDSLAVRRDEVVPLRALGLQAAVRYSEKEIVVMLQRAAEPSPDRRQLWLPF